MRKIFASLLLLQVAVLGIEAKCWKIGPASLSGMDFNSINSAMEAANVSAGDTLLLDQYYSTTNTQTITKKCVIIGTGYDTSLTDEKVVSTLSKISVKADDVTVKSVKLGSVYLYNSNCTIDRCYANQIGVYAAIEGVNKIYSSYLEKTGFNSVISGSFVSQNVTYYSRFDIQNCVIKHQYTSGNDVISSTIDGLKLSTIKNNVIYREERSSADCRLYYALGNIENSEIMNNYIYGYQYYYYNYNTSYKDSDHDLSSNVLSVNSGNTIEHNILSRSSSISAFPANKVNYPNLSSIFVCSGSYSDYYKLSSATSPAYNYANDGGEVGCHGGMFGCPAGGRPQYVPYFSKVTVGARSENGKLPVSVTVRIQED